MLIVIYNNTLRIHWSLENLIMPTLPCSFYSRPIAALVLGLSAALAQAAYVDFDLPAQSLEASDNAVAKASGLMVVLDSSLARGKTAPALRRYIEGAEALRQVLAGSGPVVSVDGSNAVVSKAAGESTLKEVSVVAQAPMEGSAAAGYLVKNTTGTGTFWGDQPLQDTRYSVNVVSGAADVWRA